VSDGIYDSGVFLEANSFFSRPLLTNGFESGLNIIPESATAKATTIQLNQLPAALLPVEIILGGTATNGLDYTADVPIGLISNPDTTLTLSFQPIPDSLTEGLETIEVTVKGQNCFEKTFVLYLADPDSLSNDSLIVVYPGFAGDSVLLLAAPTYLSGKTWTFSNNAAKAIAPALTQVTSDITISGIPIDLISDKNVVESVLINIEHGWADDLDIYLLAPGGKFLELSTDNGSNGDNYTNTCFKPTATASITGGQIFAPASAAPFTGAFQPEGLWSDLKGAPVNGTWKLSMMDDKESQQGTLLNWSISIKGALLGNYTYLWSTGDTTPYLKVVLPGTYKVKIENQVSVLEKTFLVLPATVYSQEPLYACPGDSVTYQGVTFNASHPADTFTYKLPSGAESTVFVQFQEYPSTQDTLVVILQSGETFTFNGMELDSAGDYTFVLTNQFGCDSTIVVDVNILLGTNNLKDAAEVRIVPQPLKDQAQVLLNSEWEFNTLIIYSNTGQLVQQQNVTPGASAITINLAGQPKGVYTLVLEGPLGRAATSFIKQ
jgi:subtilisin-like proprotein convertase family protein